MGENIFYSHPENIEEKQSAKDCEKEHLEERGYAHPRERVPLHVPKEEAEAAVKEAERAAKESRGLAGRKFKDWWLGVERGEGAKKFAEWIFDELFVAYNMWEGQKMATTDPEKENFKDLIAGDDLEHHIKRLAEETILHGGQEDMLLYFMDGWRKSPNEHKIPAEARQKIWEVWNEYLEEAAQNLAVKEKK